jgi:hypothetical protein
MATNKDILIVPRPTAGPANIQFTGSTATAAITYEKYRTGSLEILDANNNLVAYVRERRVFGTASHGIFSATSSYGVDFTASSGLTIRPVGSEDGYIHLSGDSTGSIDLYGGMLYGTASFAVNGANLIADAADPNGSLYTVGPSIAIGSDGALWSRPVTGSGDTGWIQLIAP